MEGDGRSPVRDSGADRVQSGGRDAGPWLWRGLGRLADGRRSVPGAGARRLGRLPGGWHGLRCPGSAGGAPGCGSRDGRDLGRRRGFPRSSHARHSPGSSGLGPDAGRPGARSSGLRAWHGVGGLAPDTGGNLGASRRGAANGTASADEACLRGSRGILPPSSGRTNDPAGTGDLRCRCSESADSGRPVCAVAFGVGVVVEDVGRVRASERVGE